MKNSSECEQLINDVLLVAKSPSNIITFERIAEMHNVSIWAVKAIAIAFENGKVHGEHELKQKIIGL